MNINQSIGKIVRKKRKGIKMKQFELAKILDLTRTSIVNIEAGRQALNAESLYRLSLIFDCSVIDLFPTAGEYKPKFKLNPLSR